MFTVELSENERRFLLNELHVLEAIMSEGEEDPMRVAAAILRDVIHKVVTAKFTGTNLLKLNG